MEDLADCGAERITEVISEQEKYSLHGFRSAAELERESFAPKAFANCSPGFLPWEQRCDRQSQPQALANTFGVNVTTAIASPE